MKLKDAVVKCVTERNSTMAGKITDILRFRKGMNYQEIYDFVNSLCPIRPAEWDALLYYADYMDTNG